MATTFDGWAGTWDGWGTSDAPPGSVSGTASIRLTASGTITNGAAVQPATPGAGSPRRNPFAQWPHHAIPHRRPRKKRQDDILFL